MMNKLLIIKILYMCVSFGCGGLRAQEIRKIDGEYKGLKSIFYFSRSQNNMATIIWNKENKLFREPMMYPKGKEIAPDYYLIDTRMNVNGNPFAKRFSPRALYEARMAAYNVIAEINHKVISPKKLEKLRADSASLGINYFYTPNGVIREVEFYKGLDIDVTIEELESLEIEIRNRLMFVTENSSYIRGNYIKVSSGWSFYLH